MSVNSDVTAIRSTVHECQDSKAVFQDTPFEYAFNLLGVHPVEEVSAIEVCDSEGNQWFTKGWEAGVEVNLDLSQMPVNVDRRATRAWLLGFVAGQYAATLGYKYPYCVFEEHKH